MKQTAMQQLLHQMKEERSKLPMPIEWDRCYQAIEMMIENTYIPLEKEQIIDAFWEGGENIQQAEKYYNETYGSKGSETFICQDKDCKHCAEDIAQMQDEDTYKVWECCGMEECECGLTPDEQIIKDLHNDRKSHAVDFAKWIAKEWMSMWVVDRWLWEYQTISNNKDLMGYKTEEQLYELYLKSL